LSIAQNHKKFFAEFRNVFKHAKYGQCDRAEAILKRTQREWMNKYREQGRHPDIPFLWSRVFRCRGRYKEAIDWLNKALSDPKCHPKRQADFLKERNELRKLFRMQLRKTPKKSIISKIPAPISITSGKKATRKAGERQTFTIGGMSIAVRFIPSGSFMMGSPDNELGRYDNEGPQRKVRLTRPFWMMQTEVTQGQFQSLMGYNPSGFSECGANCPVETVNWYEACAFANALSRKQRLEECYTCKGSGRDVRCEVKSQYRGSAYYNCKGWRLPTEAEWEYAYRGGTNTPFYTGRCISTEQANYNGNYPQEGCPKGQYRERTIAVGSLNAPNAWGLHDMAGNVWEWVHDWYQDSYRNLTGKDPVNDRTGSLRVFRGGSWYNSARDMRAADRDWGSPAYRDDNVGFRLLREDLSSN
jgi:formylglycine-generating enzyme required for sulfatase activity